ncbi:hypothetical protein OBV_34990 [Oscillibacter valericigenes Sjm18-20]|nr:hypothetical protein OBV_34990 [Oscillibacter valericigenes Sjm18-20]
MIFNSSQAFVSNIPSKPMAEVSAGRKAHGKALFDDDTAPKADGKRCVTHPKGIGSPEKGQASYCDVPKLRSLCKK